MNDTDLPLAALAGAIPPAPPWFEAAVAITPEVARIEVAGAGIELLAWGERGRPGILLMHGGMAHAHWWDHLAPFLAIDRRVAALSWSGMGGSDWRDAYSIDGYLDEAWAAATHAGLFAAGPPLFVGHSFGAAPVAVAAHRRGEELRGAIVLDSGVSPPAADFFARTRAPGGRAYATRDEALARFRFAPAQPVANLFIADRIARQSLKAIADGFTWSFDPGFFGSIAAWDSWAAIASPACPLAFVYGEQSRIATPELRAEQRARAPAGTPFIGIPDCHHHVMIDQPLALVATLRTIDALWSRGA